MSVVKFLCCQSLGLKTCINMRDDKLNVFDFFTVKELSHEKIHLKN